MKKIGIIACVIFVFFSFMKSPAQQRRIRDYGIKIGVLPVGPLNAITDVQGVLIGHTTLVQEKNIRTGVTAIVPYGGNIFQNKVPGAVYVGNGFGKLAGSTQVKELGNIETPIVLTNTLSVATAMDAIIEYTLQQAGNENVQSVNALVGETNDGFLNDIRGRHITREHVLRAIREAKTGAVTEGNVGAGTGTVCFDFKGGIGTSSRVLSSDQGGYTVGVLVQTNFGGVLQVAGIPVAGELKESNLKQDQKKPGDGSCMIVVATDAPVDARNLERMAKRGMMGLAKTGGIGSNGSGDYVIAFSTHPGLRIPHATMDKTQTVTLLRNDEMSPLFMAVIEAIEEAILNSLFAAETMQGKNDRTVIELPVDKVIEILKRRNMLK